MTRLNRIVYATDYDSRDRFHWSGLGWHIGAALEEAETEVCRVGPLPRPRRWWTAWKGRLYYRLLGQTYEPQREPFVAKNQAVTVDAAADRLGADFIFSPGTGPIAYCRSSRPVAFWTDATFDGLIRHYPQYYRSCRETVRAGHALDQRALDRSQVAIFASDWAARSALEYYRVDESKVHVVPFGANLSDPPTSAEVDAMIERRVAGRCELLFLGVDWARKGGPIALEVTRRLRRQGLEAVLHIAGCCPELSAEDQAITRLHGFLNKNEPADAAKIEALFAAAHFFLLPTRAECFGVVFAEASAFGVPSLAADVGGVGSAVANGVSGCLFPFDASADSYAEFVLTTMSGMERYRALAHSARKHYEERLNWQAAGRRVRDLLECC